MRILVTGGTGVLGREVVALLNQQGHTVRIMSRQPAPSNLATGLDLSQHGYRVRTLNHPPTAANGTTGIEWAQAALLSGEGLDQAVAGVEAIVHAATSPAGKTQAVDVDGTRRLLDAAKCAGVRHFVYISIVGIDRIPFPYYQHKLAAEKVIDTAGVPYSILRAAQFHDFIDILLRQVNRVPLIMPLPGGFKCQPIAVREAAEALATVAAAHPAGLLPDLAGPQALTIRDMARSWLKAQHIRKLIVPLWIPGKVARGFRQGYNTVPDHPQGRQTWQSWLEQTYPQR